MSPKIQAQPAMIIVRVWHKVWRLILICRRINAQLRALVAWGGGASAHNHLAEIKQPVLAAPRLRAEVRSSEKVELGLSLD
jgi:hypothetical protein